jgi:hypothetical protein
MASSLAITRWASGTSRLIRAVIDFELDKRADPEDPLFQVLDLSLDVTRHDSPSGQPNRPVT